ncbi:MAG: hypothetical protein JXA37_02410 [Chloroflexia bacterium]|nr:hypothetical protein [Chloroflexia bacterium]
MHKRLSLLAGLILLGLCTALVFLRPGLGGQRDLPRAQAAFLSSDFSTPYNLSKSAAGGNTSQRVHAFLGPDNKVHLAWMEGELNIANGAAYAKGQGTTWDAWEYIAPWDVSNRGYVNPDVALDSQGNVHAVWAGDNGPPYRIFYATKPVGGAWSAPTNLTSGLGNSIYATIAIDRQDRVWVVWETQITEQEFDIFVRSKPAGGNWSLAEIISNQAGMELEPDIAVDANDVPHVVWRSGGAGWEIFRTRYVDGAWTTPDNVSATSTPSHFGSIAADSQGNVFVVWEDEIDGSDRFQTLLRRWDGSQWGALRRVSSTPTKALYPAVSADNCNVYSVWTDYRLGNTEIYFNHSFDCGGSWHDDENASQTNRASFFPDILAQAGGFAHIVWQDETPGLYDIYYTLATVELPVPPTDTPTPTPDLTATPTHTPTPTFTPTPTPSPTPQYPEGSVQIWGRRPADQTNYTRQLEVDLHLAATPVGGTVEMRYDNEPGFSGAAWTALNSPVQLSLAGPAEGCEYKWAYAQFRDAIQQQPSPVYYDFILFDDSLTATMALNGGGEYTNRVMVAINSQDLDISSGCSGLDDLSIWEEGFTHTTWISYAPQLYFFLAPQDSLTRTVYVEYRDRADNSGVLSDTILFDPYPPYSGTAPILNNGVLSTTELIIPVKGLEALDNESGVAYVRLANRPEGPWLKLPYEGPSHSYDWSLAYGGPPLQSPEPHSVYVQYEDGAGYGYFPGNLSEVFSSAIMVGGIHNTYLPLATRDFGAGAVQQLTPPPVELLLLAEPQQAGPGEEVLIWLAARREQGPALSGTLHLSLPAGLRVERAWSAYGQLLHIGAQSVISQESAGNRQVPWILVRARLQSGASNLPVQGEMRWAGGSTAASLSVGRSPAPRDHHEGRK